VTQTSAAAAAGALVGRPLEPFAGAESAPPPGSGLPAAALGGLEDAAHSGSGGGGGADAWDQFEANKRLFGVDGGGFDESAYTTALDRNALTSGQVERARAIAQAILAGADASTADAITEEAAFSAVARGEGTSEAPTAHAGGVATDASIAARIAGGGADGETGLAAVEAALDAGDSSAFAASAGGDDV
jgi:hypothetical protein